MEQFHEKIKDQETTLTKKVAKVIDVMPEDLTPSESGQPENYKEMKEKADNLDRLVDLMKNKIKISNRRQKIQILTIAPASWSIEKTTCKTEFNVSAYMVRQARKLVKEKGILELPEQKKGKVLLEETSRCVIDFYCDDEYSRLMPGKKDFVSIAKNTHMQKRLLLCDMKETLHVCFINTMSTLPGTQSFHQFVPLSETVMATKHVLEDKSYALEYNLVLAKSRTQLSSNQIQKYLILSFALMMRNTGLGSLI